MWFRCSLIAAFAQRSMIGCAVMFMAVSSNPLRVYPDITAQQAVNDAMGLLNAEARNDRLTVAGYLNSEVFGIQSHALEALSLDKFSVPDELTRSFSDAVVERNQDKIQQAQTEILSWIQTRPPLPPPTDMPAPARVSKAISLIYDVGLIESSFYGDNEDHSFLVATIFGDTVTLAINSNAKRALLHGCLGLLDPDDMENEIGFLKSTIWVNDNKLDEWLGKLKIWLQNNLTYLYYHVKERSLKLDYAARSAGIPSKDYRQSTPWGPNEGPNVTDPAKKPSR
jgi:hypothetical protein